MNIDRFKNVELKYIELKKKLDAGEMTSDEMKQELKKMMILDSDGNYWMIGGKSGKWYKYDGTEWKEEIPYPDDKMKKIEAENMEDDGTRFFPQEEIDLSTTDTQIESDKTIQMDTKLTFCKSCRSRIARDTTFCPICGASQRDDKTAAVPSVIGSGARGEQEMLIKSINVLSMIFLWGIFGVIVGVLIGATFGIFNIMGDLIYQFPIMLQETRGKIQGGLIFALLGGLCGFISFAFIAIIVTGMYNAIASIFGGIRIRVKM